jgi:hypothetical protein
MAGLDSYVKTLLHLNSDLTDSEDTPKTYTARNSAAISATAPQFGAGALLLASATSDYIDTPASADFEFGSGVWTVDFWMKSTSVADTLLLGPCNSSANNWPWYFRFNSAAGKINVHIYDTSEKFVQSSSSVNTGNWVHIAGERTANTLRLYINGTSEGSPVTTLGTLRSCPNKLSIGRLGEYNGMYYNGRIDEFRVSKGVSRYGGTNFSVPTEEYSADAVGGYMTTNKGYW